MIPLLILAFLVGSSSWAVAEDKPVAKPKQFCEPQLMLAQTHLEKVTRERNGLSMSHTSMELHVQYLERQIADLKKKLDEAQKAVAPDAGPAADDKK